MRNEEHHRSFEVFFRDAVGQDPFGFQGRFAQELPSLIHIPTGLGKTAMAVVGWLWRRFGAGDDVRCKTPRRLVYCLPMRVLVEQTRENAVLWLDNLKLLAGEAQFVQQDGRKKLRSYTPDFGDPTKIAVHVLMGGEDEDDWDIHPEREAIIIGTQDMLLSRALNRGYAASRSRWPIQFGLLHTDCLWVLDEIQLMGSGLATTAQLEAFRRLLPGKSADVAKNGHGCRSVWMSATMQADWLKTVDFRDWVDGLPRLELDAEDRKSDEVTKRWNARKPLEKQAKATMGEAEALAGEIRQAHKPGTRTIVVVNTVKRACELHEALEEAFNGASAAGAGGGRRASRRRSESPPDADVVAPAPKPNLVLLHSRFRPTDRAKQVEAALADIASDGPGTIVVSTQVIEAGVDVSAATLFTELAPWASLVQRFGRCNRRGEFDKGDGSTLASIHWIDVADKEAAPYGPADLKKARDILTEIGKKPEAERSVGLAALSTLNVDLPFQHTHVIRKRDLIDLFDTTPDLAGNDIDIDRFVREVEESDVRVFWRTWGHPKGHEPPPEDEPAPRREELCPAPIGEFRDFAKKRGGQIWRWDFLDKKWEKADTAKITPGQVFLVHADAGGYSANTGWTPESNNRVDPAALPSGATGETPDATDDDRLCRVGVWQTIAEHAEEVCRELDAIVAALPLASGDADALRKAARWHDWGKAHEVFVSALPDGMPDASQTWAKAAGKWKRYGRRYFRHELASALAVLAVPDGMIPNGQRDLIAYLIAAHHGKVRLSIRSLPNERHPEPCADGNGRDRRFARGVWDGDPLPETNLGTENGKPIIAPAVKLSLETMELGLCEQPPFAGQPSWAERVIHLRDTLGPFRLAYLEALLRAADVRASKAAEQRAAANHPVGTSADVKEDDHG